MENHLAKDTKKKQSNLPAVVPAIEQYMREVRKYPLLDRKEELALAVKHFEDNDIDAAHRLVTANLRLVVKIANDFRRASLSMMDLIQEGNFGLMQGVKKYNPYKGVRLSSYAAWWIRAYILKYIVDNKSQVKMGTTAAQRKIFFNLAKETQKLLNEYERVTPKLLAEKMDVKESEIIEMQQRLGMPDTSLDAPIGGSDSDAKIIDVLPAIEASTEEKVSAGEIQSKFRVYLEDYKTTLKDRDLFIFENRTTSDEPLTLKDIGEKFGVSRERARQLEARVIKNLKEFVHQKGGLDLEDS